MASVTNGLFDQALYQMAEADIKRGDDEGARGRGGQNPALVSGQLPRGPRAAFGGGEVEPAARSSWTCSSGRPIRRLPPEAEYAIARTYDYEGDWNAAIRHYDAWVTNHAGDPLLPEVEFHLALAMRRREWEPMRWRIHQFCRPLSQQFARAVGAKLGGGLLLQPAGISRGRNQLSGVVSKSFRKPAIWLFKRAFGPGERRWRTRRSTTPASIIFSRWSTTPTRRRRWPRKAFSRWATRFPTISGQPDQRNISDRRHRRRQQTDQWRAHQRHRRRGAWPAGGLLHALGGPEIGHQCLCQRRPDVSDDCQFSGRPM